MPTKKTTKAVSKKAKQVDSESESTAAELTDSEKSNSSQKVEPVETIKPSSKAKEKDEQVGQLLFSTDGSEPEKPEVNSFDREEALKEPDSNVSGVEQSNPVEKEKVESVTTNVQSNQHNSNQQNHQGGGNRNTRKQNWQEKKKGRNKPRPKFKKPRKLPYEDTESKPLELGNLLEFEELKTDDGLSNLAEVFAGSGDEPIKFNDFYQLPLPELKSRVCELSSEIEMPSAPVREEVFDLLFDTSFKKPQPVQVSAILEVTEDGHGFLLHEKDNYRLKSQSPFVPEILIKRFGLKTGHLVQGFLHPKIEGSSCPILVQIDKVMDGDPEEVSRIMPFTELIPYYPLERMFLETSADAEWDNVSMRVVDLVSPVGFGQRGLIVAPPRTGKTVLQQAIARSLRVNNPQAHLIVLLVDERPEEVTDFRRQVPDSEVIASTFDESAQSHVHAAEIVIEKARRMVECNQDVVILLDSITRLARAYNTTMPNSGKILSGGVEATALQRPKRFFGSARNIEGGGSLTILGTALVETGSKMDEVIFEEFKGTGNMELHLDRELSNKRIFPALDFEKSGTRKEELLYHPDELNKIYSLRRSLKGVPPVEAMEMFIQRVRKTKNNPEFLMGLGR